MKHSLITSHNRPQTLLPVFVLLGLGLMGNNCAKAPETQEKPPVPAASGSKNTEGTQNQEGGSPSEIRDESNRKYSEDPSVKGKGKGEDDAQVKNPGVDSRQNWELYKFNSIRCFDRHPKAKRKEEYFEPTFNKGQEIALTQKIVSLFLKQLKSSTEDKSVIIPPAPAVEKKDKQKNKELPFPVGTRFGFEHENPKDRMSYFKNFRISLRSQNLDTEDLKARTIGHQPNLFEISLRPNQKPRVGIAITLKNALDSSIKAIKKDLCGYDDDEMDLDLLFDFLAP